MNRDELWLRRKQPGESWPRFTAEIPPELAEVIDAAQRKSLGVNATSDNATRANAVRSGLRLYVNHVFPLQPPVEYVDGSCEEIIDVPLLGP